MSDEEDDTYKIYNPWAFIHSEEFTTDIVIEDVKEIYSTGPAETAEGEIVEQDSQEVIQYCSYKREEDESDVHEEKFILRFLATNTNNIHRYMWVTGSGEVRTDGGYTNIATFFEVIHWCSPKQNSYQLICYGGGCKGYILYVDGTNLCTRKYNEATDDHDITTKFQMCPRGDNISVRAFISKTGVALYFDDEGNYRPEGPPTPRGGPGASMEDAVSRLHPLYFITSNVKVLRVTSV